MYGRRHALMKIQGAGGNHSQEPNQIRQMGKTCGKLSNGSERGGRSAYSVNRRVINEPGKEENTGAWVLNIFLERGTKGKMACRSD